MLLGMASKRDNIIKRRRETWYSVGALAKNIVDGMKVETTVTEKSLSAVSNAQEVYRGFTSGRRGADESSPLPGRPEARGAEATKSAPAPTASHVRGDRDGET